MTAANVAGLLSCPRCAPPSPSAPPPEPADEAHPFRHTRFAAAPMPPRIIHDVVLFECDLCHAVFLDHVAIERIVTDHQAARADAILAALPRAPVYLTPPGGRMYINCPVCATIMNRKQFSTGSGVIIDVCRDHGAFFDPGELPAVIDFVMRGGLAHAREREREREREATKREQANAAFAAMMASRSSTYAHRGARRSTTAEALADLLYALWK
jgi:Zn-finger nucleic acid-binding protein